MHELKRGRTNGRLIGRVVGEFHGWQEFFPVQSVIMQVRAEVIFDQSTEVFNLGIALRVGRSCLGVLDIQDGEELGRQLVDEFFFAVGMNLGWWGKSIDPAVKDHLRHRGSFFVRNWHNHCNFGEGVGHAQDVFVVAQRFEWPVQINMDPLVRLCRDRQWGQRGWLRVTLAGSLAPRAALDVLGDVESEGRPPPGSCDSF